MGFVGLPTAPASFVGSPVGWGRGPAVRASRVCPCARVTGVVPVTVALACASWNGTPRCPGAVTTLLVNAATSRAVRSSQDLVCVGPERGNTGPRAAMAVKECYQGTPRERPWAGSRAVSCSRKILNVSLHRARTLGSRSLRSSFARLVVALVPNCRRNSATLVCRRTPKIRFQLSFRDSACPSPMGRGRRSAGSYIVLDSGYCIV